MSPRSKARQLPPDVKAWLDQALVESNFSDYDLLAEACKNKGIEISRSSLHRYGSAFEKSMADLKLATEQAIAITAQVPDDENALGEALLRLIQEKTFTMLQTMDASKPISLDKLAKIASDTAFAGTAVKEFRAKVKAKAAEAAKTVSTIVKKAGLTPDQVNVIKRSILGIAK
jgi:hypothetical protein